MKQLTVTQKVATPIMIDGKPSIQWKDENKTYLVSSTKSQNNLVEELQENGVIVGKQIAVDWFLKKDVAEKHAKAIVTESGISQEYASDLEKAILSAFRSACITKLEK